MTNWAPKAVGDRRESPLETPIQYLKGVGPKRAVYLNRLGVETVRDLLFLVPRRYLDRTRLYEIKEVRPGDDVSIWGKVIAAGLVPTRNRGELVSIRVQDRSSTVEAIWFSRPDLKHKFKRDQEIIMSGRVSQYRGLCLVNPQFELIDAEDEFRFLGAVIPIYPLTEGLGLWEIRNCVRTALDKYLQSVPETLSPGLLAKYGYPGIRATVAALHSPATVEAGENARLRLVFEELFYLQLAALRKQQNTHQSKGLAMLDTGQLTGPFQAVLPFRFTAAQERVLAEIKHDMALPTCMNRLLQGDVGSGKTVLAIHAMLIAVENGFQAAMMAPTEILAEQHHRVWSQSLADLGVECALLTGSVKAKPKRAILEATASGACRIVFGTHALIEGDVKFARLGLVVVDEQHRFGAMQRLALMNKGVNPDFLVMTATPIPRTIELTRYGDMDVSRLDQKPPGRQKTRTFLRTNDKRPDIYKFVRQKIAEGQQVFVVCPLIEESEKLDIAAATRTFEEMRQAFPGIAVGLLHGRLKNDERVRVMEEFRAGRISILVSTTVIEVGVDIPRATVMIIEHPERFGLAQLHQLRGRIGRGADESYCILIHPFMRNEDIMGRLSFFQKTDDGFKLAEKDLELRKAGDLYGFSGRQHGMGGLSVADPLRDIEILERARREAISLLGCDPRLSKPENRALQLRLVQLYGEDRALPG